jgi:threonine dehydrogenase-like Zn-dependent dehydrogenase
MPVIRASADPTGEIGVTNRAMHTTRRLVARSGRVEIIEQPVPEVGPGDVLVKTVASVISPGTERAIIAATGRGEAGHEYPDHGQTWPHIRSGAVDLMPARPRGPLPDAASLGYSLSGRVVDVGSAVRGLRPGDLVACCGNQCAYHAEFVVVPRNLVALVPAGLDLRLAAHGTLGAIALEAFRAARCSIGEQVAVLGAGMLGLLIIQIARAAGVDAIALEIDPSRQSLAESLGATVVIADASPDSLRQALASSDGFGADAAIIAAADPSSTLVNAALDLLRVGGRVVALGDFGMNIERRRFFRARATLVPAVAYGPGRYDPVYEENHVDFPVDAVRWTEGRNLAFVLRLIADQRLVLTRLPRLTAQFDDAARLYDQLTESKQPLTGVLLYPSEAGEPDR